MSQPGLFDWSNRLESLSKCGDPLERLFQVIDFEIFRKDLEDCFNFGSHPKGGRPPYDAVLIFKILVLQTLYNLSDDQVEFQIKDRLSFMRFLGLSLWKKVPDAKTVWLYRDRLKEKGLTEVLFTRFDQEIRQKGYIAMSGQIVDASIVQAPKQRMKQDEKAMVKMGGVPEGWKEKPAKLSQKDLDARWMVKYRKAKGSDGAVDLGIPFFGYKNHVSCDRRFGFIRCYKVTDAARYDGHVLPDILDQTNTAPDVWGDTAYRSEENENYLRNNRFWSRVHYKKLKGKSLPVHTARGNRTKSGIRSRVEHIFAAQKSRMVLFIRTIGLGRAEVKVGLANLVYNLQRFCFWEEKRLLTG